MSLKVTRQNNPKIDFIFFMQVFLLLNMKLNMTWTHLFSAYIRPFYRYIYAVIQSDIFLGSFIPWELNPCSISFIRHQEIIHTHIGLDLNGSSSVFLWRICSLITAVFQGDFHTWTQLIQAEQSWCLLPVSIKHEWKSSTGNKHILAFVCRVIQ